MNIPDDIALEAMSLRQLKILQERLVRVITRRREADPIQKARRNAARLRRFMARGKPS